MLDVLLENEGLQGEVVKEGDEEEIEERGEKNKEDEVKEEKNGEKLEEMLEEAKFKRDKGMVDC